MKALIGTLVVLFAVGCGTQPKCAAANAEPASACANRVTVDVRDSADASVRTFSGTIAENSTTQAVACGVASDAGLQRVDCADGGFSFFATSFESPSFQASLTAGDAGFNGAVPINWERGTAPADSCHGHCSNGSAVIVVQ